jgi:hypothetical protein
LPAEDVTVKVAPVTSSLLLFFAIAVIVDDVLPSAAIVVGLAVSVMLVTPLEPPLELLLEPLVIELPPQAESSQAVVRAMIDNLCIFFHPRWTAAVVRQRLI